MRRETTGTGVPAVRVLDASGLPDGVEAGHAEAARKRRRDGLPGELAGLQRDLGGLLGEVHLHVLDVLDLVECRTDTRATAEPSRHAGDADGVGVGRGLLLLEFGHADAALLAERRHDFLDTVLPT